MTEFLENSESGIGKGFLVFIVKYCRVAKAAVRT